MNYLPIALLLNHLRLLPNVLMICHYLIGHDLY